ncbi:glycosyltransferase [Actinoplanes sp. NPDC049265]|uniref:glycosyltransferase n=1 Tax=Actinoplanes sp. NPDC049265 TaxID=3363902 RepID=UPI003720FAB6
MGGHPQHRALTMSTHPTRVQTPHWTMTTVSPGTAGHSRSICIATVHPIGDQRIVRCAQALADAGHAVHFVWLGGEAGHTRYSDVLAETRIKPAASFRERVRKLADVTRAAWRSDADIWHIHDFYMLPFALVWRWSKRRPVVYDVHEFYPEYYAGRLPLPAAPRRVARRLAWAVEKWLAKRLGAVNVVNDILAQRFRRAGVKVSVTPNFPALNGRGGAVRELTPELLKRVIHTGTLSAGYGAPLILETAHILADVAPDVEITVIKRFLSRSDQIAFEELLERRGCPANLTLLEPMPVNALVDVLSGHGIGLSALQTGGQNDLAIPTKLFEYVSLGLAVVTSDLAASRTFMAEHGRGELADPRSPDAFANGICALQAEADRVCAQVNEAATRASTSMSWERMCAPELQRLVESLQR